MKSVLISIQPYWVFLIIAKKLGWNIKQEKTIEVRKSHPKDVNWDKVAKIYCSQDKKSFSRIPKEYQPLMKQFLGKVIGEFVCNKVDRMAHCGTHNNNIRLNIVDENFLLQALDHEFLNKCKLSYSEIEKYSNGGSVYGWHISNLVIYDKPRKLSEFRKPCKETNLCYPDNCNRCIWNTVTGPPQSWCYVESEVQGK